MLITNENLEYIKSVCERFNIAFKKDDKTGLAISNKHEYKDLQGKNIDVCLSLEFWQKPTIVQMEFIQKYFIAYEDDLLDEDCGWQTSIWIKDKL